MNNEQTLHDVHAMVSLIKETTDERNKNIDIIDAKVNKLGNVVVAMSNNSKNLDDKLTKQSQKVEQLISVEEDIKQVSETLATRMNEVSAQMSEHSTTINNMTSDVAELGQLNRKLTDETKELVTTHSNDQMERTDALKANIDHLTGELKALDKTEDLAQIADILKRIQDKTQEAIDRNKQSEHIFKDAIAGLTAQIATVEQRMSECVECYADVRKKSSEMDARTKAIEFMIQAIHDEAKTEDAKEPEQEQSDKAEDNTNAEVE